MTFKKFHPLTSKKHLLYSGAVLITLLGVGGVVFSPSFSPQVVYAVSNGLISENQGIIMNTGAIEAGNPEGRVYCIDAGTTLYPNGATAGLSDTGSGAAGVTWGSLSQEARKQVQVIGWLSFNNSQSSAAKDNNMYLASQCLIWDVTTGQGLPAHSSTSKYNPSHFGEGSDQAWYAATPNTDSSSISRDIDFLLSAYQNFIKVPQFDKAEETIHLGETASFTDKNQVLTHYGQITSTDGFSTRLSGNNLSVTATKAGTGTVTLSNGGVSESDGTANSGGVHVWFTNNPDGSVGQNVIYSEKAPEQNVKVRVKVIPSASLKITKRDNVSGKIIPGTVFVGLNQEGKVVTKDADGKPLANSGKFITGEDGTVTIKNLMADPDNVVGGETDTIVTLRELSVPAPYSLSNNLVSVIQANGKAKAPSTDLPITLLAGTSSPIGVTFSDHKQVQAIKVIKRATLSGQVLSHFPNRNYSLEGAVFTIKNETESTIIGKLYTNAKGEADLSELVKVGDSHQSASQYQALLNQLTTEDTYSIQETEAPFGLACDWNQGKPQTFKLSYSGRDTELINPATLDESHDYSDTPITVDSLLKKVDSDSETSQTQGSALLEGTVETLFYKVDVKDNSGKVIHHAGEAVQWMDGFSELPITSSHGQKVDKQFVSLQVTANDNQVGVKHLPLTALSAEQGYVWRERDAKGKLSAGYGYTANTQDFGVASGLGNDGTGQLQTVISDTNLVQKDHVLTIGLAFTKVLGDKGSLTGENGAVFEVKPIDQETKPVFSGHNGQTSQATSGESEDINGYTTAGLTSFKFAIGNYRIHQTVVPEGTEAVQDILVKFTPESTTHGAPKRYTLQVSWADGTKIYNKTFEAEDFTDGHSNLIQVNLGTVTDNKVLAPTISTHATDSSDGEQLLGVGKVSVTDESTIQNLPKGDYTEVTHWVDSKTGSAFMINGKPALVSKDFSSQGKGEDKVTTSLSFDTSGLQGKSLTAEEFVYPKGQVLGNPIVSESSYKNNPKQTVKIVKHSGTTQVEAKTIEAQENASYIDDYKGTGFVVGNSYRIEVSSLWDKTAQKLVPAKGSVNFEATSSTMTVKISIHLDSRTLEGHDLVTFEDLYVGNQKVLSLHDKNALSETVHVKPLVIPKEKTSLPHTGDNYSFGLIFLGSLLLGFVIFLKRHLILKGIDWIKNKFRK